jgi:ribosomal protein L11 methylase PrmA
MHLKIQMKTNERLNASFRDPSGFLFTRDGVLYRQVNQSYAGYYRLLVDSGLYDQLVKSKKLIPHQEVDVQPAAPQIADRVLQPERVAFISYPYEWCFSQLKDAALLTLSIQKKAFEHGQSLKDASAYNIQFHNGRPILIDTLSFEPYEEGAPWIAYRQFCQHFLAPLALMAHTDVRLSQLLRVYIDGVPLDLTSKLLPARTRFNPGLLAHLHLHAGAQQKYAGKAVKTDRPSARVSKAGFQGLFENLESTVRGLQWEPKGTEWGDYYDSTNYTRAAFDHKVAGVKAFLAQVKPAQVWDLGSNTGVFSRLAASQGIRTVSSDIDPAAVEKNYQEMRKNKETHLLPLVMDLTNPSPAIGWQNHERSSWIERGPVDCVMALALIHHLAISNNVPLVDLAEFFARVSRWLILEFVPKEDSQVQRLLATRADIFPDYHTSGLEAAFQSHFEMIERRPVEGSQRTLYLLRAR